MLSRWNSNDAQDQEEVVIKNRREFSVSGDKLYRFSPGLSGEDFEGRARLRQLLPPHGVGLLL